MDEMPKEPWGRSCFPDICGLLFLFCVPGRKDRQGSGNILMNTEMQVVIYYSHILGIYQSISLFDGSSHWP